VAGTDKSQDSLAGGPAIILVDPQLGENIGTAARAMLNFGLTDLRLVRPRDGWPNERAISAASGADKVLDATQLFDTTAEAIADLNLVFAATARDRDMRKPVFTPESAATRIRERAATGDRAGYLFGPERAGLDNNDVALADSIMQVTLNPAFSSLNLAQAVLIVGYEYFRQGDATPDQSFEPGPTGFASKQDLIGLFEHLEGELHRGGFLYPPEKTPTMVRNIRNMLQRAHLTEQEVRMMRGMVSTLTKLRGRGQNDET
jgi:tRNA/rRNA methyltransferase